MLQAFANGVDSGGLFPFPDVLSAAVAAPSTAGDPLTVTFTIPVGTIAAAPSAYQFTFRAGAAAAVQAVSPSFRLGWRPTLAVGQGQRCAPFPASTADAGTPHAMQLHPRTNASDVHVCVSGLAGMSRSTLESLTLATLARVSWAQFSPANEFAPALTSAPLAGSAAVPTGAAADASLSTATAMGDARSVFGASWRTAPAQIVMPPAAGASAGAAAALGATLVFKLTSGDVSGHIPPGTYTFWVPQGVLTASGAGSSSATASTLEGGIPNFPSATAASLRFTLPASVSLFLLPSISLSPTVGGTGTANTAFPAGGASLPPDAVEIRLREVDIPTASAAASRRLLALPVTGGSTIAIRVRLPASAWVRARARAVAAYNAMFEGWGTSAALPGGWGFANAATIPGAAACVVAGSCAAVADTLVRGDADGSGAPFVEIIYTTTTPSHAFAVGAVTAGSTDGVVLLKALSGSTTPALRALGPAACLEVALPIAFKPSLSVWTAPADGSSGDYSRLSEGGEVAIPHTATPAKAPKVQLRLYTADKSPMHYPPFTASTDRPPFSSFKVLGPAASGSGTGARALLGLTPTDAVASVTAPTTDASGTYFAWSLDLSSVTQLGRFVIELPADTLTDDQRPLTAAAGNAPAAVNFTVARPVSYAVQASAVLDAQARAFFVRVEQPPSAVTSSPSSGCGPLGSAVAFTPASAASVSKLRYSYDATARDGTLPPIDDTILVRVTTGGSAAAFQWKLAGAPDSSWAPSTVAPSTPKLFSQATAASPFSLSLTVGSATKATGIKIWMDAPASGSGADVAKGDAYSFTLRVLSCPQLPTPAEPFTVVVSVPCGVQDDACDASASSSSDSSRGPLTCASVPAAGPTLPCAGAPAITAATLPCAVQPAAPVCAPSPFAPAGALAYTLIGTSGGGVTAGAADVVAVRIPPVVWSHLQATMAAEANKPGLINSTQDTPARAVAVGPGGRPLLSPEDAAADPGSLPISFAVYSGVRSTNQAKLVQRVAPSTLIMTLARLSSRFGATKLWKMLDTPEQAVALSVDADWSESASTRPRSAASGNTAPLPPRALALVTSSSPAPFGVEVRVESVCGSAGYIGLFPQTCNNPPIARLRADRTAITWGAAPDAMAASDSSSGASGGMSSAGISASAGPNRILLNISGSGDPDGDITSGRFGIAAKPSRSAVSPLTQFRPAVDARGVPVPNVFVFVVRSRSRSLPRGLRMPVVGVMPCLLLFSCSHLA